MPIYEYRCTACDERFEKLVRSAGGEAPGPPCPACGSDQVRRLVSRVAARGEAGGEPAEPEAAPPRPPVFGRQELQALKNKPR